MGQIERWEFEAAELERRAQHLREAAASLRESLISDRDVRQHQRMIRAAAIAVMKGKPDEAAAAELSARTPRQISQRDAIAAIAREIRTVKSLRNIRRNREVMRLARAGWTNAEIGDRFRMSERQVSRIVNDKRFNGGVP